MLPMSACQHKNKNKPVPTTTQQQQNKNEIKMKNFKNAKMSSSSRPCPEWGIKAWCQGAGNGFYVWSLGGRHGM